MADMNHPNGSHGPARSPSREHTPAYYGLETLARRTVVAVLTAVLLLSVTYLLWRGAHVLLMAFAGVLFGVFLSALSERLSDRTGLTYRWSLGIVLIILIIATTLLFWLLANRMSAQLGELSEKLPLSLEQIRKYLAESPWGRQLLEQVPRASDAAAQLGEFSRITGLISGAFTFAVTALVIFFVGVFGAAEPQMYREGLFHVVPEAQRPRVSEALDALTFNLRWWLVSQAVLMVVIGLTTALGLWLIGVPEALALGIIAGVFELVPYLGPWISAVPAALVALLVSPSHLMMTLALYLFLHLVEAYVLLPLIQRKAILLPPALGLVAQVLLGDLFGILGLFVAAPLTLSVLVLVKMLYVKDTLGDDSVEVPGEPAREEKQNVTTC